MPPPVTKNLSAFQQLAKKAASSQRSSVEDLYSTSGSQHLGKHNLTIHKSHGRGHQRNTSPTNVHGDGSSQDDFSSGDASDADMHQRDAKGYRKGLVYQKTENIITKIRDLIAQSDVFISRRESPPFVAAIKITICFIPILLVALIWDTLAVTAFQVPHLCWIDHPAFILGWHFIMLVLAMYGFMLSFLSSGNSPRTSMAGISLGVHYILLIYRIFMEIYFDGFRGQEKLWIESRI